MADGFVDVCDLTADDGDGDGAAAGGAGAGGGAERWSKAPKVRTEVRLEF